MRILVSAMLFSVLVASARPPKPAARFTAAPASGAVPLVVQFTNQSVGSYNSIVMNFGDGATKIGLWQTVSHSYVTPGSFVAAMTVFSKTGSSVFESPIVVTNTVLPSYVNVTIAWTNPPSCTYTAYQGIVSEVYTRWIMTTNMYCTFSNMAVGTKLYFSATATTNNNLTSPFASELTFTP